MDARLAAQARGKQGEARVAKALSADGWTVLSRNWRGGGSELDLVVARGSAIRFVEVKTRAPGDPVGMESVGPEKQAHLVRAARAWMLEHPHEYEEMAFMVALVEPDLITWIDDAFDAE